MTARKRMAVGVNYPWVDYGFDFGVAPPSWRSPQTDPAWCRRLDSDLAFFRTLGISVVRWFILGDGLTYGSGSDAPHRADAPGSAWSFQPPTLGSEVVDHFTRLLRRFSELNEDATARIQLLPVFIDYLFCSPGATIDDPEWVKQGRADAIADRDKRQRFLDSALVALLDASNAYPDVIYAWELINEPEWVTNGWHPDRQRTHEIDELAMRAFLEEGNVRIRRAGFKSTIGFASSDTLKRSKITCDIDQFHHYPDGRRQLRRHAAGGQCPAIIGEFATSTNDTWPELNERDQRTLSRLRLAERLGYPLAMPWSYCQHDRHTMWTRNVEDDILCFTQGRNCPENDIRVTAS